MRERLGVIALGIAGLLLVGVVLLVIVSGRSGESPDGAEPPTPPANTADGGESGGEGDRGEQTPDVQVSGTELTIREEGEVVWHAAFGGEIELDEKNNVASATDVTWEFKGQGFKGLTLEAPMMRANWSEGRLRFSDGIVIVAEERNLRFSADTAVYQFDTKKVIGRGNVRFQRGNFYGRAEEVVVDNRRRTIRLKRGTLTRRQ